MVVVPFFAPIFEICFDDMLYAPCRLRLPVSYRTLALAGAAFSEILEDGGETPHYLWSLLQRIRNGSPIMRAGAFAILILLPPFCNIFEIWVGPKSTGSINFWNSSLKSETVGLLFSPDGGLELVQETVPGP
jgi:hypothetical protein